MGLLAEFLQHPLTKDLGLDDPRTTNLRREIIGKKPFLKKIYEEWYEKIMAEIPAVEGYVLEIGSGAGFFKFFMPDLIATDVMLVQGVDLICDARQLPFKPNSLRAIVLVNVLHHLNDPEVFLRSAERCLEKHGKIIMIEPWVTCFSRIIYKYCHHEPCMPEVSSWITPDSGPLSGGNQALPWILFHRDKELFEHRTNWKVYSIKPFMPFKYLLSGGASLRQLLPSWSYSSLEYIERHLPKAIIGNTAMFALITLQQSRN